MGVAGGVRAAEPVSLSLGQSKAMSGNVSTGQGPDRKHMAHSKG